jgi:thiopeptide-type bacteriocin biosynthesis protein
MIEKGTCTRFAFDTYEAEVERFGGPEGMTESERLFHADSGASADLVRVLKSREWSADDARTILMALTVDDLLRSTGMDEGRRLGWYKSQIPKSGPDAGPDYRRLKDGLRAALGDPAVWLSGQPSGAVITAALDRRGRALPVVTAALSRLAAAGVLNQSIDGLCSSYTHLHLNRIGGASREQLLLGLLRRARESLAKAPLGTLVPSRTGEPE